jgi:hypothetical protein
MYHRNPQAAPGARAGDVIGMLVRDQDGVERFDLLADGFQARTRALKLRPASTRMRVRSVASSAQLPELPLASTQNLTHGKLKRDCIFDYANRVCSFRG